MIIPPNELNPDVLYSIAESFITRDGTDYGEFELSLAQKVDQLIPQIKRGDVLVVFDPETESVSLLTKEQYRMQQSQQ